jgi:tetratricopeptide (TPR) repeat protein
MSARVVVPFCIVVWVALGFGAAQSSPVSRGASTRAINEEPKAEASKLNRQGSESVAAKQFDQAEVLFKRAIELDPKFSDAYENLALILLLRGNDVAAEHVAAKLLALAPANYNARLVAGVAAINCNNFSQGRSFLAPLIRSREADPLVTTAYAVALKSSGDTAQAASFKAITGVEDSDALLAGQIFRHPRLKEVAQKWMEASAENAGATASPDLLYLLATMYTEQGRRAAASALYSRILEADPGNVDALVELSELERALGQQEKAVSHLYAAKTLAATDPATLFHYSQVCMRRQMYVDASDALKKVVAQDPRNRRAWYQLGLAQFRIAETGPAEKDFRSALKLDGDDGWSRIGLGAVLMSTGRQEQATAEFNCVLRRDPSNAAALYYLAQIHRTKGDVSLALRELQKAVDAAKEDARPWAALGQLQLAQNDLVSARLSLNKAIELNPGYPVAHYHLARLLKVTGESAEAAKEMDLFTRYHEEENKKGIVGLVGEGKWDYAGFLPPN